MNYYNPYFQFAPYSYAPVATSRGLLSRLFGGSTLSSIINGTQRTLGIINQAIPLVKQVNPVIKNAKTMFKVMSEFKKTDTTVKPNNQVKQNNKVSESNVSSNLEKVDTTTYNGPTFFL